MTGLADTPNNSEMGSISFFPQASLVCLKKEDDARWE